LVLENNIIKEQFYLGTIFIYKNTLLKNTVEWNTPRKIQGLMGFWTCTGEKKEDICKEFERESPILAYTKRRKKIAYLFSSLVFPSL